MKLQKTNVVTFRVFLMQQANKNKLIVLSTIKNAKEKNKVAEFKWSLN